MLAVGVTAAPEVGVPLGILIGVITGVAAVILMMTAWGRSDLKAVLQVIGELLAIPTFWFGGPWLTTQLMASVEPDAIRTSYLISLAATFVPIAAWPVAKIVYETGRRIGVSPMAQRGGADA